jgi:molybdenum cofactor cytidylyltransferase
MGRLKQLLPLGGKTIIRHCLDTLVASETDDIVVVVGPERKKMEMAMRGFPVKVAVNDEPESDMAESVRAGLMAVDACSKGLLICLSDHPLVTAETVKALVTAHAADPFKIIIPVYDGKRGHPSIFPRDVIEEIFPKGNLREIICRDSGRVKYIDVRDEGTIIDIDTAEDYEAVLRKQGVIVDGKKS